MNAAAQRIYDGRWKTLAVLCLSLVIIVMDNTILNVALPSLSRDLGATNSQLQWIVDAYTIVFAGLLLTFGTIGDKFGRKGALSGGIALFALGSTFAALATTAEQLIAARAFTGIGGALIMPATLSILTNVFTDPKERAKAIAIWSACSGIGIVVGPLLGGFLLEHSTWHTVFWINLPLLAGAFLAGRIFVPKSRDDDAPRLDLVGAGMSIVALSTLLWAIIEAPGKGWTSTEVLLAFAVAITTLVAFIFWERSREFPMLDVRFFSNPRFSAANGAVTLTFFGMFGSLFLLTQWLQFVKGYSTLAAGVRVIPFALGMAIAAPLSNKLVERIGTKLVVAGGLGLIAVGLATMTVISADTGYAQVMSSMLVMAFGMGLTMAPATESVMGSLPPEKAGVGSAVNDTTRELGGAFGVAVIGSFVSSAYASNLAPVLSQMPADARNAVSNSLGAALQVSEQVGGSNGQALARAAQVAFSDALGRGFIVAAVAAVLGVIAALMFLPAHAVDMPFAATSHARDPRTGAATGQAGQAGQAGNDAIEDNDADDGQPLRLEELDDLELLTFFEQTAGDAGTHRR